MDLKRRAFTGILWTFTSQLLVFGAQFGTLAVLARLLTEAEMGVATLAMAVTTFAMVFAGLGLSRSLVQRLEPSETDFSTGFWGSLGFGVLCWGVVALAAPLLADFYGEPVLAPLVMVSGAGLVLASLPQIHQARLERGLRFRELGLCHVFGYALPYGVVAITSALMGAGVWAPVYGGLAAFVGQGLMQIYYAGWRPSLNFEWRSLKGLMGFGMGITGASVVAFALDNLDYFIVGKALGTAQLGFYTIAFQITSMPRSKISSAVLKVAFPTFSQIQTDKTLLNRSYIALNRYVAFVTFPMMAGLFVVAEPFVVVLLGEKWLPAVPALEVLCIAGALMSIRSTVGTVLNAVGRADLGFYSNFGVLVVAVPVLLWLAPMGIEATGLGVVIVAAVNFLPLQFVLTWLTGLSVSKLLKGLAAPLILSVVMALLVSLAISPFETPWVRLVLGILVGVVVYVGLIFVFAPSVIAELKGVIRNRRAKSSGQGEGEQGTARGGDEAE